MRGTAASRARFALVAEEAAKIEPHLEATGRVLFADNLRLRATLLVQLNTLLFETTQAYHAKENAPERQQRLTAARAALADMKATLQSLDHGPFKGWYNSDRVFRLAALATRLDAAITNVPK